MTTPHEGPDGYDDTPTDAPTDTPAPPVSPPVTSGWVTEPAAEPAPEPELEPEPQVEPESAPALAPTAEAAPHIEPEPVSAPQVEVEVEAEPEPEPASQVEAEPAPAPEPEPVSAPESAPESEVAPEPQPAVPTSPVDTPTASLVDTESDEQPVEQTDEHVDGDALGVPAVVPTRPRSRLLLAVLSGLTALAVLGFAGVAVFTQAVASPVAERDDARDEALRTARDAARLLLAYDYRRLDEDFAAGAALTADPFKSEYERTTTRLVRDVATQYKAVVRAEVVQAGAVEVAEDRVVALLFVNQTTTSTRVQGAKVDLSRVRMVLQRIDGSWRVTGVDAL
ncbi:MAG: hypothetical protein Q8R60_13850 [Mycobacteriales bacterium]|nr:hypothetical protein [Mycobacteriales bacterium]